MATGACGIDCDVCRLKIVGICSSCGPAGGETALRKLDAQRRLLGQPCPILECARDRGIDHCLRDCRAFPCGTFEAGPYPYSQGYLNMQHRRRLHKPLARTPVGGELEVPAEYWRRLAEIDPTELCRRAQVAADPPDGLIVPFLADEVRVDLDGRRLEQRLEAGWAPLHYPLLELVVLVYLLNVCDAPLTGERISVHDLSDAHFFQGPHQLRIAPLLELYGRNAGGFRAAAERLGGRAVALADAAYRFLPLPKIPLYYLLWEGDAEFAPELTVLFDRSIERHLTADAVWGLVNLVTDCILTA